MDGYVVFNHFTSLTSFLIMWHFAQREDRNIHDGPNNQHRSIIWDEMIYTQRKQNERGGKTGMIVTQQRRHIVSVIICDVEKRQCCVSLYSTADKQPVTLMYYIFSDNTQWWECFRSCNYREKDKRAVESICLIYVCVLLHSTRTQKNRCSSKQLSSKRSFTTHLCHRNAARILHERQNPGQKLGTFFISFI